MNMWFRLHFEIGQDAGLKRTAGDALDWQSDACLHRQTDLRENARFILAFLRRIFNGML